MTFDRRRSELRLAACAASICLVSIMKTKLQNLTHTTPISCATREVVRIILWFFAGLLPAILFHLTES